MKVVRFVVLTALALVLAACGGPEQVGVPPESATAAGIPEPAAAGTPEPATTVVTPEQETEAESEFDRLVGRLCGRLENSEFQANLQKSVEQGGWVHDYDAEFRTIVNGLEALADRHGSYEIPVRLRCPEEWFGFVSIFTGKDRTTELAMERLAARACARLREPEVVAWLEGQAGAVADDELVATFQEAWELEVADVYIEQVMGYHCEDVIEQVRAAVAVVGGGPEMEQARAWAREACPKFERALRQPETVRAQALALAVASERRAVAAEGMAWEMLLPAMTVRCPETASAVAVLPG